MQSFRDKGLQIPSILREKADFLQGDLADVKFGLPTEKYQFLLESVDTGIHNTWAVNFNHPIEGFEFPHLIGTRRLVEFALEKNQKPHLHFVSSVSTVGAWLAERGDVIPEEVIDDPNVSCHTVMGNSSMLPNISAI